MKASLMLRVMWQHRGNSANDGKLAGSSHPMWHARKSVYDVSDGSNWTTSFFNANTWHFTRSMSRAFYVEG